MEAEIYRGSSIPSFINEAVKWKSDLPLTIFTNKDYYQVVFLVWPHCDFLELDKRGKLVVLEKNTNMPVVLWWIPEELRKPFLEEEFIREVQPVDLSQYR